MGLGVTATYIRGRDQTYAGRHAAWPVLTPYPPAPGRRSTPHPPWKAGGPGRSRVWGIPTWGFLPQERIASGSDSLCKTPRERELRYFYLGEQLSSSLICFIRHKGSNSSTFLWTTGLKETSPCGYSGDFSASFPWRRSQMPGPHPLFISRYLRAQHTNILSALLAQACLCKMCHREK